MRQELKFVTSIGMWQLYDSKTLMPIFSHILLLYWLLRCSNFRDITSFSEESKHGYVF